LLFGAGRLRMWWVDVCLLVWCGAFVVVPKSRGPNGSRGGRCCEKVVGVRLVVYCVDGRASWSRGASWVE